MNWQIASSVLATQEEGSFISRSPQYAFAGLAIAINALLLAHVANAQTNWTQVTPAAPWTAREQFGAIALNGRMWVMGGAGNNAYFNDAWSSADGTNWVQVTSGAPWSERGNFGAVTFNGRMWVLGGYFITFIPGYGYSSTEFNDVWSSSDGTNWTEVTSAAPWSPRYGLEVLAFNGQMWVLGGHSNGNLNDVWASSDGTNWTRVTSAAPWSGRSNFGAMVFSGEIWVLGGSGDSGTVFGDVWSSTNGVNWIEVTNAAPWGPRENFGAVTLNDQLWVIGGQNGGLYNDAWYSPDGLNWTQPPNAAPWSARSDFGAVTFDGRLWVLGGPSGYYFSNDVWSWGAVAPSPVSGNSWTDGSDKWENAADWSLGVTPSSSDLGDYITNASTKTVIIDTTTATNFPSTMTIGSLTIMGSADSGNTLILDNAGSATPLQILGEGLTLDSNALLIVNNSTVLALPSRVTVGYSSVNSLLVVSDGGAVNNSDGYVGFDLDADDNAVLVSGSGSVWSNNELNIGYEGSGNQLLVEAGGVAYDSTGYIGWNGAATNNSALITGSGSTWSNSYELIVGYAGEGNQLIAEDGGIVYDRLGYIGYNWAGGAAGNSVMVSGEGSVWSTIYYLYVGYSGAGNQLTVEGGGAVYDDTGYIGENGSATNNSALITGVGSVWSNSNRLIVGDSGAGNQLIVIGGGVVYDSYGYIGGNGSATNNSALITGVGSVWSNQSTLFIGFGESTGNSMTIADGGAVYSGGGRFGSGEDGTSNSVFVSGSGSVWNNNGSLSMFGSYYSACDLIITNGGTVIDNNALISGYGTVSVSSGATWQNRGSLDVEGPDTQINIGAGGSVLASNAWLYGFGNLVSVAGGALYVTNAPGSGSLVVQQSSLSISSGTVTVNGLVVERGGLVSFAGGTLNSGGTSVNNGQSFVFGNGTSAATFNLLGGVHIFADNLEISNNATLTGCGTIDGNVIVDPGGSILAGCGGTLTFVGIVTNNGVIATAEGTTIDFRGPVAGSGTIISSNGTVQFLAASLETSVSPPNGGTTSGAGSYSIGSNVTACALANPCFGFVNWTDQNSNVVSVSACYSFALPGTETLTANFTPISGPYTVTTTTSPLDSGSISGNTTVPCGSAVTVCATPNTCYSFVNWTDQNNNELSTSACYTFNLVTNEAIVANFSLNFCAITTSSSPAGSGSISGGGAYGCGLNVTVCAMASNCDSFVNWIDQNSNVLSTSACYTFTVATNESVVANFAANSPPTGSLTNLWSFTNGPDGANPMAGLVQGNDTNFYGTTYGSGSGPSVYGTVFRISPGGSLTNVWSFTGGNDGANPQAGLVQGSDSNFYGTTAWGGANGYGTVFRISPSGSLTNLWSFTGGTDGDSPQAGLVQGSDGNFYGTASYGGVSGNGTVFRISPSGSLTSLWSFTGGNDGANPQAGLVQGSDGNFYGTTYGSSPSANGTVFRISPSGILTTLWSFTGGSNGAYPWATLVQGSDSNFYGTASYGGAYGAGTVFRISPSGSLTSLWSFTGGNDGATPQAGLVQGSDGNFYGTASYGGAYGAGTVFRISPSGSLTNLWSFTGCGDGANPYAGLLQSSDGNFYGTTTGGGTNGYGTVFVLDVAGGGTNCTFSITSNSANFSAAGGSCNVGVTASNGCAWTASTTNSWITITSGSSGTGNSTVAYTVATNTSATSRSGTMTIGTQTFTIDQAGTTPVTYSFTNIKQTLKTDLDKKTGVTTTNCTITVDLVVQNTGTTEAAKSSVLLWLDQGCTFNPSVGLPSLTEKVKALKTDKSVTIKVKTKKLVGDLAGTFIFATDADTNVLASVEVQSPE